MVDWCAPRHQRRWQKRLDAVEGILGTGLHPLERERIYRAPRVLGRTYRGGRTL
jgi:hypothetical protein